VRHMRVVATLIFLFLPAAASAQQPAKLAGDKVRVAVYRYRQFIGKGLRPSIYCDEKDVARLQSGRYVVLALAPGRHAFRSNDKQAEIDLDLQPSQEHYIRMDIAPGIGKGHGRLTLVPPEQGMAEFKHMKPIDAGMIKDRNLLAGDFEPRR